MKIAIFGGTFDPVHNAHLTVAREALRHFGLDQVLFIPAALPPHKVGATYAGYEHRYRMVGLACQGDPQLIPSRLEAGEEKSYSINTIEKVKATLGPEDALYFLVGADAFAEIKTWHRWQDVVKSVEFIVVSRMGHEYEVPDGARIHRLETVASPVSSSEIRARLRQGGSDVPLPGAVLAYIRERGLYCVSDL